LNCKKCAYKMVFIGSAQNGWMWYCRKCTYLDFAKESDNRKNIY